MKFKKLLLFVLLFFFCLILKNNVNAYVVNEGGQGKYYLQDLPFDDSGETFTSVFFLDYYGVSVYCYQVPNYVTFAYDRIGKTFYPYDNTDGSISTILCYTCGIEEQDGLLIGGNWSSTNHFKYSKEPTYIGGTGRLYPSYSNKYPITTLPDGVSWGDDFLMYYQSNYGTVSLYYPTQFKNGVFAQTYNQSRYYNDINSTTTILYSVYKYDFSNSSWTYVGTNDNTPYGNTSCYFYNTKDILDNNDRSVVSLSSTKDYFKSLYEYRNFPYILNGQEDLAKGEEDIIIMPRRFYKYRKDYI